MDSGIYAYKRGGFNFEHLLTNTNSYLAALFSTIYDDITTFFKSYFIKHIFYRAIYLIFIFSRLFYKKINVCLRKIIRKMGRYLGHDIILMNTVSDVFILRKNIIFDAVLIPICPW